MKQPGLKGRGTSRNPKPNEKHCGELDDHAPHTDGEWYCPGGPLAAPGNTKLKATK